MFPITLRKYSEVEKNLDGNPDSVCRYNYKMNNYI